MLVMDFLVILHHFLGAESFRAVREITRILLVTMVHFVIVQCGLALGPRSLDGLATVYADHQGPGVTIG